MPVAATIPNITTPARCHDPPRQISGAARFAQLRKNLLPGARNTGAFV
jgi:hypothetical protein